MKIETRVGLFILVGLIVLGVGIAWKSNLSLRANGYMIGGSFVSVKGLLPGAEVRYRGYLIGTVSKIIPNPKDIRVYMFVKRGVKIPEGSTLRVDFDGLIGEKYINLIPNPESDIYVPKGAILHGHAASSLVDFVHAGTTSLLETREILTVLRKIITSEESQSSIQELIININNVAARMDTVLVRVDRLMESAEEINLGERVDKVFDSVQGILAQADGLVKALAESAGEENVGEIVENFKVFSDHLNLLAESLNKDKENLLDELSPILSDVKQVVEDSKKVSGTLAKGSGLMDQVSLNVIAEVFHDQKVKIGSKVSTEKSVWDVSLGAEQSNQNLRIKELTYGRKIHDDVDASVGLVNYSAGVKVDWKINLKMLPKIWIESAVYNISQFSYMLRGNVFVLPNMKAIFGYQNNHGVGDISFGVGVQSF